MYTLDLKHRLFSRSPPFNHQDLCLGSLDLWDSARASKDDGEEDVNSEPWELPSNCVALQGWEEALSARVCARHPRCYQADRDSLCLVARPRQQPIASARCWPSTRRMSSSWKTTRSWPAMWVPPGFSWPGPSKALPPHPRDREPPEPVPPNPSPGNHP